MRCHHPIIKIMMLTMILCGGAMAQDTGSITGTVRDSSGAVVPGATVKLMSSAIGVERAATTNAEGDYLEAALPIGTYDLSVTAQGFKAFDARGIILRVSQKVRVDVTLEVGQVSEKVVVQGENVAQVQTASSDMSSVVTGKEVGQLELNGRNFVQLINLVPGVSDQSGSDSGTFGYHQQVQYSINGGRGEYNNWQVDGANMLDTGDNTTLVAFPSVDAIAEFTVMTSNYGAQYGRNGSGTIEATTKSGTNQFHGNVYEFARNDFFNANDYFDNLAGNRRPSYKKHDFGYTIGGPVVFPGYNKKRDKTFFFWSQEWRRERDPYSFFQQVPSLAERGGCQSATTCTGPLTADFSDICTNTDPNIAAECPRVFNFAAVPIDPNALTMLSALIPAPNSGSGAQSFFNTSVTEPANWRQELLHLDHNFTAKLRASFRYIHDSSTVVNPKVTFISNAFPAIQTVENVPGTSAVLRLTATPSATVINEAVFNYSANHIILKNTGPFQVGPGLTMTSLFPTGPSSSSGSQRALAQLPAISLANGLAYGGGFTENPGFMPWENANPVYDFHDNVTKIIGPHNLQFGGEFVAAEKNEPNAPTSVGLGGTLTFDESSAVSSGNSFADFLLGNIAQYQQTSAIVKYYYRYKIFEPYFNDDWRVNPHLTLNLGLRFSLFGTNRDRTKTSFNFDPKLYSPAAAVPVDTTGSITGVPGALIPDTNPNGNANGNPFNGFVQCGGPGGKNVVATLVPPFILSSFPSARVAGTSLPGCQSGHLFNPAPRIGFAFDPRGNGKMAIRGGYGIFFEYGNGNEANAESLEGTPPRVLTPGQRNISGYTSIGGGGGVLTPLAINNEPPANIETRAIWPYVQQWHLDYQFQVAPNTVATVSYVGSKGTHLTDARDIGQLHSVPAAQNPYSSGQTITAADCSSVTTASNGSPTGATLSNGTILTASSPGLVNLFVACGNNADPFRPYVGFSTLEFLETQANSHYHAFQASVRRSVGSLVLAVAYTYSHSIDDSSDRADARFVDSYNLAANKASSNFDQRHILNFDYVYDLPLFKKSSGVKKTLLGGWQWSGIASFQSGVPIDVTNGIFGDNAGVGNAVGTGSRPDLVGDPNSAHVPSNISGAGPLLFNDAAFAAPQGLTFGNVGRNILNLPHRTNFDMGIYKHFVVTESKAVEFRWETFNTFNHTQFNGVDSAYTGAAPGTGTFLHATSTHDPRVMQFGLKFQF